MALRTANAVWNGTLKEGKGRMTFGSGAFDGAYSFASRFEEGTGTNPEELLGAAHAGCFSMAFSGGLTRAGFTPTSIATKASVRLEKVGEDDGLVAALVQRPDERAADEARPAGDQDPAVLERAHDCRRSPLRARAPCCAHTLGFVAGAIQRAIPSPLVGEG